VPHQRNVAALETLPRQQHLRGDWRLFTAEGLEILHTVLGHVKVGTAVFLVLRQGTGLDHISADEHPAVEIRPDVRLLVLHDPADGARRATQHRSAGAVSRAYRSGLIVIDCARPASAGNDKNGSGASNPEQRVRDDE